MKKLLLTCALAASLMTSLPTLAADEFNVAAGLTATGAPLALHGADPVAFIDMGNRAQGRAEFAAVYEGVAYYFATKANMQKFENNAATYVPQNGGFCTFGVSVGKKFDGNPQYADVVDGKLYVFLNEEIYKAYQNAPEKTIHTATKQWPKIQHKAALSL